jgi:hypothetical protein
MKTTPAAAGRLLSWLRPVDSLCISRKTSFFWQTSKKSSGVPLVSDNAYGSNRRATNVSLGIVNVRQDLVLSRET